MFWALHAFHAVLFLAAAAAVDVGKLRVAVAARRKLRQ